MVFHELAFRPAMMLILPMLRAGLKDGLAPGAMTAVLTFVVFLYTLLHRRYPLKGASLCFIFSFAVTIVCINFGALDHLLATKGFWICLNAAYVGLIIGAFVIGGTALRDWITLRVRKQPSKIRIRFLPNSEAGRPPSLWRRVGVTWVLALGLGVASAFVASAWAPDVSLYEILRIIRMAGTWQTILSYLFIYGFGFIMPFLLVSAVILILNSYKLLFGPVSAGILPKLQIVTAGIFLAFGVALLVFFFEGTFLPSIIK